MKPTMLIILDGFGIRESQVGNAVKLAKTPTLDELYKNSPHTEIYASEEYVGLPHGQMGNSEVGHLNIGAGRVIYQNLTKITEAIKSGEFFKNSEFKRAIDNAKKKDSKIHLIGLVSKGGVHSHFDHLLALIKLMADEGMEKTYIHAITDGRDVSPHAAIDDIKELQDEIEKIGKGKIATISGRYYAMDRDNRWERSKKYYDDLTSDGDFVDEDILSYIKSSYDKDITDEFLLPAKFVKNSEIEDGDSIIIFNFRPDRVRQITRALVDDDFKDFEREKINTTLVTMTDYDKDIKNKFVAFKDEIPKDTLGEILEKNKIKQLRIAETEKYAHVTFFFNGGREKPFEGEDRVLIPSPKVATYDLKPEMSANEVTDAVIEKLREDKYGAIILNFANTDMVGHTGDLQAAIKAVETVDRNLGRILKSLKEKDGVAIITADHGNCECMIDDEGKPVTSHTTNPVPVFLFNKDAKLRSGGALCDLSPTILKIMGIEKPELMTGKSLF
uniref:2,3-bisphosphoglycerate-independent phosphoglycerate mutase n=1 Tax=Peptoniphilus grossensis TaxID=1465756 RepID=UPI00288AA32B|nr:2,3-bisphosphoglycerate-independent phosphoglycerate mutase [Peptoniphilus grossensis]